MVSALAAPCSCFYPIGFDRKLDLCWSRWRLFAQNTATLGRHMPTGQQMFQCVGGKSLPVSPMKLINGPGILSLAWELRQDQHSFLDTNFIIN